VLLFLSSLLLRLALPLEIKKASPSTRQFSPGVSGVGEVLKVEPSEFAHLLANASESVQGSSVVLLEEDDQGRAGNDTTSVSNSSTSDNDTQVLLQPHAQIIDKRIGYEQHVELDRRKGNAPTQQDDLSFSGLLNGELT